MLSSTLVLARAQTSNGVLAPGYSSLRRRSETRWRAGFLPSDRHVALTVRLPSSVRTATAVHVK